MIWFPGISNTPRLTVPLRNTVAQFVTSNLARELVLCLISAYDPHLISISRSLRVALSLTFVLIFVSAALATSQPHVIAFGKWTSLQWSPDTGPGAADAKPLALKVRPLLVDARVKEFTLGPAHDITDRLFVVRRAL